MGKIIPWAVAGGVLIGAVVAIVLLSGPKDVVAKVDGESIKEAELDRAFDASAAQFGDVFKGKDGEKLKIQFKKRLLDGLVTQKALLNEAKKRGIKVTDAEVDEQIKQIETQFGGKKGFDEQIKELKLTREQVRVEVANGIVLQKYQDDFGKGKKYTDKELKAFYDENNERYQEPEAVNVRHILVKTKKAAAKIREDLGDGADFEKLAKSDSEDPGTKEGGGNLGFITRGQMFVEFEKAAFELKKGALSKPIKTESGYHIIELLDRRKSRTQPFKEVKERIGEEKGAQGFEKEVERVREAAKVTFFSPYDVELDEDEPNLSGGAPQDAPADPEAQPDAEPAPEPSEDGQE